MRFNWSNLLLKKVISGGSLDIDVMLESPSRQNIYERDRQESDYLEFNTTVSVEIKAVII